MRASTRISSGDKVSAGWAIWSITRGESPLPKSTLGVAPGSWPVTLMMSSSDIWSAAGSCAGCGGGCSAPERKFAGMGTAAANGEAEPETIVAGGSSSASLVCGGDPPPIETEGEKPVFPMTVAIGAGPLAAFAPVLPTVSPPPASTPDPWPIPRPFWMLGAAYARAPEATPLSRASFRLCPVTKLPTVEPTPTPSG